MKSLSNGQLKAITGGITIIIAGGGSGSGTVTRVGGGYGRMPRSSAIAG